MPEQIYSVSKEFVTHIENISLHLMIDKPYHSAFDHLENPYALLENDVEEETLFYRTRHSHISSELFVCREGEMLIDTSSSMLVLHAGDAAIIPPGIPHYKVPDNKDDNYYAVRISCKKQNQPNAMDLYKQFRPFFQGEEILIYRRHPESIATVSRILALAEEPGSILPAMYMTELLLAFSKHAEMDPDAESNTIMADSDYGRLNMLEQWVTSQFMHTCTQKEIAAKLHISPRQLDRIARKHLGMTVHQAVMERRISTAESMLLSTDMTAEKIGFAVGFSSLSGFYKEFTKKHGITPAAFRNYNIHRIQKGK